MRRPRSWELAGTVMYSKISRLSQMWLPVVMTWAPRSKSSSAMEGVMPKPPAAFSPLMTRRSTALVSRTWGRCSRTMWRPAEPKTSPTKRIFTKKVYMVRGAIAERRGGTRIKTGNVDWMGVLAFLHGTEWAVSTKRASVGGAGERSGCDAHVVGNCGGAERERCDGAPYVSAVAEGGVDCAAQRAAWRGEAEGASETDWV